MSHTAPVESPRFSLPRTLWVALGAAILAAVGTLLPWASIFIVTISGTSTGDGQTVLVLAILAALGVLGTSKWQWAYKVSFALGLGIVGITLYDAIDYKTSSANVFGTKISPSLGGGLILALIAGVLLVGALASYWRSARPTVSLEITVPASFDEQTVAVASATSAEV
jgi:hypothetical protein